MLISAQEQERKSIARELHDHINQRLALLAIETQEFEHSVTGLSPEQLQQIDQLWELTTDISRDVQALSYRLHSSQLRHLGLLPAIRGLCQDFTRAEGIEAECRTSGTPAKLNEDVSLALFRIVQEALRNAQRYSHAQHVTVEVAWTAAAVCVAVTDDGVGFDPAVSGSGLGLISMKERMRLVAGELSVISAHGAGTRVEAHVPLVQGSSVAALPSVPARVERRKRARA